MGISANQARLLTLTARQHDLELRAQQISAQKMVLSLQSQGWATKYSSALNDYSIQYSQSVSKGHNEYKTLPVTKEWLDSKGYIVCKTSDKSRYTGTDYETALKNGYAVYLYTPATAGSTGSSYSTVEQCVNAGLITAEQAKSNYVAAVNDAIGGGLTMEAFNADYGSSFSVDKFVTNGTMVSYSECYWAPAVPFSSVVPNSSVTIEPQPEKYTLITERPTQVTWVSDDNGTSTENIDLEKIKAEYDSAVKQLSSIEKLLDMELTQVNTEHEAVKTEYDSIKSLISDNVDKSFNVFG